MLAEPGARQPEQGEVGVTPGDLDRVAERDGRGPRLLLNDLHLKALWTMRGNRLQRLRRRIGKRSNSPPQPLEQLVRHIANNADGEISTSVLASPKFLDVVQGDFLNAGDGPQ